MLRSSTDGPGSAGDLRKHATELAALAPDVIFAAGGTSLASLLQVTRDVPIVFAVVHDPVGSGFVDGLARPGGNATGFMQFEYNLSGKWLGLLKQIAPSVTRAAVLRDPAIPPGIGPARKSSATSPRRMLRKRLRDAAFAVGIGQFAAIRAVGSIAMELSVVGLRAAGEVERGVTAFARQSPD